MTTLIGFYIIAAIVTGAALGVRDKDDERDWREPFLILLLMIVWPFSLGCIIGRIYKDILNKLK